MYFQTNSPFIFICSVVCCPCEELLWACGSLALDMNPVLIPMPFYRMMWIIAVLAYFPKYEFTNTSTFHCCLYQCSGTWFSESDFVPLPSCMALYCLSLLFFFFLFCLGYSFIGKFLLLHQNLPCSPPLNFLVLDPDTASEW